MSAAPAGWYPDPESPDSHRYWDGHAWADPAPNAPDPAPGIGFGAVPSAPAAAPHAFAPLDSVTEAADVGHPPVAPIGDPTAIPPTFPPPTVAPAVLPAPPLGATAPNPTPATPPPATILSQRRAGTPFGLRLVAVALVGALTGAGLYLLIRDDSPRGAETSLAGNASGSSEPTDASTPESAEDSWTSDPRLEWLNQPWEPQTSASGRYTFHMPAGAQQSSTKVPTPSGQMTVFSTFSGVDGTTSFEVGLTLSVTDLSEAGLTASGLRSGATAMLESSANRAVKSVGAPLDSYDTPDSALGPACLFSGTSQTRDLTIRGFIALRGTDVISFVIALPLGFGALADQTMAFASNALVANW